MTPMGDAVWQAGSQRAATVNKYVNECNGWRGDAKGCNKVEADGW